MPRSWSTGSDATTPQFSEWVPMGTATQSCPSDPGVYIIKSKMWSRRMKQVDHAGPASERPWQEDGVLYVGQARHLASRLRQFAYTIRHPDRGSRHPCAFRVLGLAPHYAEFDESLKNWTTDLAVAVGVVTARPPRGIDSSLPRWQAAARQGREAVEATIIADTIAYRLAHGRERFLLLNHVDLKTWKAD